MGYIQFARVIVICLFFISKDVVAQQKNYFPVWTYHQNNTNIHGLSVGTFTARYANTLTNGMKVEFIGLGGIALLGGFNRIFFDDITDRVNGICLSTTGMFALGSQVNGIAIGGVAQAICKVNGVAVSAFGQTFENFNGLTLGMLGSEVLDKGNGMMVGMAANRADTFNGIQIAFFFNTIETKGTGLQIGLFNKANNFKGIQIGFWNENQKRKMPIINWNFRD
ncbi:LA_2272 family surface repeat-containing protein [Capnocytophaga canimorsus]|uniref:Uncharacterized protein n=1 Tax=Capnocytophaga canimorsus (strain 5) TaxID=860228 RepID=F9YPC5_CAPCC|nr:hypothetical protein [Capnocytophaga canimorsus]AEK23319.1 Hypothetical protein Ccan_12030 [Capnocytophaga canimorsus Cc5]